MNPLSNVLSLATIFVLAACGSEPEPDVSASVAAKAAQPAAASLAAAKPAPDEATAKMAKAVGNGKPGAAVDIRYEFGGRPALGAPTELQIALVPNAGVDSMEATVSGMEGITLAGPLTASFANVEPGNAYTHTVSLLPDRNGVFYVSVNVNTQIGGSTLGRTFSIPFVVGAPAPQKKAEPVKDASGEAIESMKAEESTS